MPSWPCVAGTMGPGRPRAPSSRRVHLRRPGAARPCHGHRHGGDRVLVFARAVREPIRSGGQCRVVRELRRIARARDGRPRRFGPPGRARRRGRRPISDASTQLGLEDTRRPDTRRGELRERPTRRTIDGARPAAEGARHHGQHGARQRAVHCGRRSAIESAGREHGRGRVHVRLPDAPGAVRADSRGVERRRAAEPPGVEGARSARRAVASRRWMW